MLSKSALRLEADVVEGLVDSPRIKRMRISKAAAEAERNGARSRSGRFQAMLESSFQTD
jgi:hypothetical protein